MRHGFNRLKVETFSSPPIPALGWFGRDVQPITPTHPKPAMKTLLRLLMITSLATASLDAQNLPYGAPISLEHARTVLAAAKEEAVKNNWIVAIAIVDAGGHLVLFERMDSTQYGSADVSIEKARTASGFRRPSKVFQDAVAAGGEGVRMLVLTGAMAIEGGVPLVQEGRIVGAIGISGVTSAQDGQIARAGAAALR
jgi:glc operon protein GlcG